MAKTDETEDSLLRASPTTSWLFCMVTEGMPTTTTGSLGAGGWVERVG